MYRLLGGKSKRPEYDQVPLLLQKGNPQRDHAQGGDLRPQGGDLRLDALAPALVGDHRAARAAQPPQLGQLAVERGKRPEGHHGELLPHGLQPLLAHLHVAQPQQQGRVAQEGRPMVDQIHDICGIVNGDVSAEVVSTDAAAMIKEGRELSRIHSNVVVKCPLTRDGIRATAALSAEGIRVNVTLCFSSAQALLAAKAGAYIVSPFVGRLDDIAQIGMDVVREIKSIYENYGFKTQILAASIRSPLHVAEAALAGAEIATMPFKVLDMLFNHPLTDKGLEQFLKDYNRAYQAAVER